MVLHFDGSLVIYILPFLCTVHGKKSFFENFMLWYLCCRISNYGDNGPLGYGLSCHGGHWSDPRTFIHFHLGVLWIRSSSVKKFQIPPLELTRSSWRSVRTLIRLAARQVCYGVYVFIYRRFWIAEKIYVKSYRKKFFIC